MLCGMEKTEEGVEDAKDMCSSEVNEWPPGHMGCHGEYQKAREEIGAKGTCSIDVSAHSMGIDKCTSQVIQQLSTLISPRTTKATFARDEN